MIERLCKNCKHWEKVPPREDPEAYIFDSVDAAGIVGYGLCCGIIDGCTVKIPQEDPKSIFDDAGAFTYDGSGYRSCIFTGPDHYCAKFEERPWAAT